MGESQRKELLGPVRSLVVKLGTSVLASPQGRLDTALIQRIADQVQALEERGLKVAIVSSGAIGAGLGDLGLQKRPETLPELQGCAAVGQAKLMAIFDEAFRRYGRHAAQILLTRSDMEDRDRYLNVRNCIHALQAYGAVPVINENDTVAVDEIRFGDNDVLAAMVTNLLRADLLVLLTTVEGLYRDAARAETFDVVEDLEAVTGAADASKSALGTGGMRSKLEAVAKVVAAGELCVIADGRRPNVLADLLAGQAVGTLFLPKARKLKSRRRWLGLTRRPRGRLIVDEGAAAALRARKSLLAIGILRAEGPFEAGDVVLVVDAAGRELAQGLSNYSSRDVDKIKGLHTRAFRAALGSHPYDEVIHADNLVLMA
jgi:glutamate 5-kinase